MSCTFTVMTVGGVRAEALALSGIVFMCGTHDLGFSRRLGIASPKHLPPVEAGAERATSEAVRQAGI